jgi:hypothetical protein
MSQTKRMSPYEYESLTTYSDSDARDFQHRMDREGWDLYQINSNRSGHFFMSIAYKREMPRDENGFTIQVKDESYYEDEVTTLEFCKKVAEIGFDAARAEGPCMAYQGCAHFLFNREWIEEDMKITTKGRIALAAHYNKNNGQANNEVLPDLPPALDVSCN